MEKQIEVYTQPGCAPCAEVKYWLHEHGYTYTEHNIRQDEAALQRLLDAGFRATPVTFIGDEAIPGYNPRELERAIKG